MKGLIALDVDGTMTADSYQVPLPLINYLHNLTHNDWKIAIITGRSLAFCSYFLSSIDFPCLLAVQNGSTIIEHPSLAIISKKHLAVDQLFLVEKVLEDLTLLTFAFSSCDEGDECFIRHSSIHQLSYIEKILQFQKQKTLSFFHDKKFLQLGSLSFMKCVGSREKVEEAKKRLEPLDIFHVTSVADPGDAELALLLITNKDASKGEALKKIITLFDKPEVVIAAGNDENDLSMFAVADIKISMEDAPLKVLQAADVIAPSAKKMGLLPALQEIVDKEEKRILSIV